MFLFTGPYRWVAPEDWPVGDQPAIYRGFESETELILNGASLRLDTVCEQYCKLLQYY